MNKLDHFFKKIDKTFFFIVILAIILRFMNLNLTPPSLNWDEVSHGVNAFSILETGKDEWGLSFPTIFRAYGDYKLPVYIYITALSEKVFGLSPFAVRLPSILAGIGTVIMTYYLTYELFKKKKISRISAFLVAVEPWSLFLSRAAFEANLALFFIVSGIYLFLKSIERPKALIFASIFLGLSVWTYNSARVFVPLILLSLILIYRKELFSIFKQKSIVAVFSLVLTLLLFVPMFIQLLLPTGQARYNKVSIINEGAISSINESRGLSKLSPILNRFVNNKVTYFTKHFAVGWASHFSPSFLFFKGGTDYQFSVPGRGIIYIIEIIPIIVGLLWIVVKRPKAGVFIITWLILAPIPSSITNEAPHVLRAIVMLPIPMILSALGICFMADWLHEKARISRKITITIFILIVLGLTENYLINYFTNYRTSYSWSWQYGYKETINYIRDNYSKYDRIIMTKKYGEPHEFMLFYMPWDIAKYQNDPSAIKFYQSEWYWVDRFDKFYFVNDWQIPKGVGIFILESRGETVDCTNSLVRCLLITSPGKSPLNWKRLTTINFLNNDPAFEIYDNLR